MIAIGIGGWALIVAVGALLASACAVFYTREMSHTYQGLLANDTACIWRHRFEPGSGVVTPFRSGYANAPCPEKE